MHVLGMLRKLDKCYLLVLNTYNIYIYIRRYTSSPIALREFGAVACWILNIRSENGVHVSDSPFMEGFGGTAPGQACFVAALQFAEPSWRPRKSYQPTLQKQPNRPPTSSNISPNIACCLFPLPGLKHFCFLNGYHHTQCSWPYEP